MRQSSRRFRNLPFSFLLVAVMVALAASWTGCGSSGWYTSQPADTGGAGGGTGMAGRVIDSAMNEEVPNAVVTIQGRSATSDFKGLYALTGLTGGPQEVTVTCEGFLPWSGTVTLAAGTITPRDFYIAPPSHVEGTVWDGNTNRPIPGASVTVGQTTRTCDANGHYVIDDVAAGVQTMQASAQGYAPGAAILSILAEQATVQDFILYPPGTTGTVQGTVTDVVSGVAMDPDQVSVGSVQVATDQDGKYKLAAVPSGTQVLVSTAPGYNTWQQTIDVGNATTITQDIRMAQPGTAGRVDGQVVDMNTGANLEGVRITIGSQTATTARSGKYSFGAVPVGRQGISTSKKDYIPHSDWILIEPDGTNGKTFAISQTPLRKGPYLLYQNDTGSMTVQWQTFNTPRDARIDWGETTAYGNSAKVDENSAATGEHRFSHILQGLAKNTKYYYQVSVDGQTVAGSFKSAPGTTEPTYYFYAYGDTRANHTLWTPPNNHERVCRAILDNMKTNDNYQTLLLHNGDIVRHGLDEAYWDTQYFMRMFPAQLEVAARLPVMGSVGNHECYISNDAGLDLVNGGALLRKYWPYSMYPRNDRFYYSFDYGQIHFTCFDTWVHPDYKPGTDQYEWLAQDLASTDRPWKVVFMHTPDYDVNGVDPAMSTYLTPLFKSKGVNVVISGHAHHYSRCEVDGLTYLTLGGGGAPIEPVNPTPLPYVKKAASVYHFGRFEVSGDTMSGTVIQVDGTVLDAFTIRGLRH